MLSSFSGYTWPPHLVTGNFRKLTLGAFLLSAVGNSEHRYTGQVEKLTQAMTVSQRCLPLYPPLPVSVVKTRAAAFTENTLSGPRWASFMGKYVRRSCIRGLESLRSHLNRVWQQVKDYVPTRVQWLNCPRKKLNALWGYWQFRKHQPLGCSRKPRSAAKREGPAALSVRGASRLKCEACQTGRHQGVPSFPSPSLFSLEMIREKEVRAALSQRKTERAAHASFVLRCFSA